MRTPTHATPSSPQVGFQVLDRLRATQVRQLLALAYGGLAVAIFIQNALVSSPASAAAFSFLFGAMVGTKESILIIIFASTFGVRALGKIQGLATGVGMISTGIGPLAFSACRDLTGGYSAVATFIMTAVAAAGVALFLSSSGRDESGAEGRGADVTEEL